MIRLDLGAEGISPEGFTPMGHDHGTEIYPLPVADGSVDVIRASHVLEHFPHGEVPKVLADWVRALKPGGELMIAVPDFEKIAQNYLDGVMQPTEGYTMGGQTDADDFHKSLFDRNGLRAYLAGAGLMLLEEWQSDIRDCAALPISLNWKGKKPYRPGIRVKAIMSTPRLGFNDMWMSALLALPKMNIDLTKVTGAFWDQCLTSAMDEVMAEDPSVDYLLAIDYDSVFHAGHVARLVETVCCFEGVDALAPMQSSRHNSGMLFGLQNKYRAEGPADIDRTELEQDLFPARNAHFGLTLISTEKLRSLPRPWMFTTTDKDGKYGDGHVDPDIQFWRNWELAGNTLFLAPRVTIGHIEVMVRWPDINMQPCWQSAKDWETTRQGPENVWTGKP